MLDAKDRAQLAKHWLSDYRDLCCRRDALVNELDSLRAATTRATGHLSQAHIQRLPAHGSFEDRSLELVEAQARLQTLIAHISESLTVRLALIEQLEDERHRLVLTLRYINGLEWFKVEHAMHYERRQVFYFHSEALKAVGRMMDGGEGDGDGVNEE
ncbi:MAG TPA: hypothetical protein PK537_11140 [Candidatus Limiplasma sp.]|nr:hypothetical protein [Candidatus Limiplasma sp.]